MSKKINVNIEFVKLFSSFCVVGLHTVGKDISVFNSVLYYLCGSAVPLFFMVNGFFIANREDVTYSYSIKKVLYLIRIVFLWTTLVVLIKILSGNISFSLLKEYIKPFIQKGVFYQFWFLGALIIIYLCLPLLSKLKKNNTILILCVVTALIFTILSLFFKRPVQAYLRQTFRIWTWFLYFLLGGYLNKNISLLIRRISLRINIMVLLLSSALYTAYAYFVSRYIYDNLYAEFHYDNPIFIIWCICIFLLIYRMNFSKWDRLILYFSQSTLTIFIIHPLFIRAINLFYEFDNSLGNLICWILIFFGSVFSDRIYIKMKLAFKL